MVVAADGEIIFSQGIRGQLYISKSGRDAQVIDLWENLRPTGAEQCAEEGLLISRWLARNHMVKLSSSTLFQHSLW